MRFSIFLFALYIIIKTKSFSNKTFKKYLSPVSARLLIKTANGERARLFIFDKGRVSSKYGDRKDFDVALVWKDAKTGLSVMTDRSSDASFNAAAEGKLKVLGMSIYAQWFENCMRLIV